MVDPPARGVTSRSRKRGSFADASESRSGGERHGAPRATPRPLVGEPHPEETLEAPELRSLRAAKHDELLPQRQIFEREVGAGSKRRTQRAQQRVRGTLPPWLARRWVIVQSLRRDFGKRQPPADRSGSRQRADPRRLGVRRFQASSAGPRVVGRAARCGHPRNMSVAAECRKS